MKTARVKAKIIKKFEIEIVLLRIAKEEIVGSMAQREINKAIARRGITINNLLRKK